jgi:hypothetical protein
MRGTATRKGLWLSFNRFLHLLNASIKSTIIVDWVPTFGSCLTPKLYQLLLFKTSWTWFIMFWTTRADRVCELLWSQPLTVSKCWNPIGNNRVYFFFHRRHQQEYYRIKDAYFLYSSLRNGKIATPRNQVTFPSIGCTGLPSVMYWTSKSRLIFFKVWLIFLWLCS